MAMQTPTEPSWFFSGYDCDSLALESLSGFAASALSFFKDHPLAQLELRTKSVNTQVLEKHPLFQMSLPHLVSPHRKLVTNWNRMFQAYPQELKP